MRIGQRRGKAVSPVAEELELPPPLPGQEQRAPLYRIAYEQGLAQLSDQVDELNGMRTRAVSFMAFIGTATAFLVTTTLKGATPDWPFYLLAFAATCLEGYAIVQLVRLLRPEYEFILTLDPRLTIAQWIDREVPPPSEAELLRGLAGWLSVYAKQNEVGIDAIRGRFSQVIGFGASGILLWTFAIWAFGRLGIG